MPKRRKSLLGTTHGRYSTKKIRSEKRKNCPLKIKKSEIVKGDGELVCGAKKGRFNWGRLVNRTRRL